jgi:hypothetical protein
MKTVEGFVLRKVGDEYIISGEGLGQVNLNRIFSLNSTAAFLWQSIEGKDFNAAALSDLLVNQYHIDASLAQRDAQAILNEWIKAGIVK